MVESFNIGDLGKFNRVFKLEVDSSIKGLTITIESPFTLEFDVTRNNLASANTGSFTVYNLGELTRKQLFKDQYDSTDTTRKVRLYAGYDNGKRKVMARVFNGYLLSCLSERERCDFSTKLECFDAGTSAQTTVSLPIGKGTTRQQLYQTLLKLFPELDGAVVGMVSPQVTKRDGVLMGNVAEILREMTNNAFHIDSNTAFILGKDEVIATATAIISSETGLLGSPRRSKGIIEFDMIFEPRLQVNQMVTIASTTNPIYNGTYKLTGLTHRGVISGSVGGDCTTTATMVQENVIRPVLAP